MTTNPAAQDRWSNTTPIRPYAGTIGHSGTEASEERAERHLVTGKAMKIQDRVLVQVLRQGGDGLTIAELREAVPTEHHGTLSGALTALHKGGRIARLKEVRRGKCSVYVVPECIEGRETVAPRRNGERDPELNAAVRRIQAYLVGRRENKMMSDRDVIGSAWRSNSGPDAYDHLRASDLETIMKAFR